MLIDCDLFFQFHPAKRIVQEPEVILKPEYGKLENMTVLLVFCFTFFIDNNENEMENEDVSSDTIEDSKKDSSSIEGITYLVIKH